MGETSVGGGDVRAKVTSDVLVTFRMDAYMNPNALRSIRSLGFPVAVSKSGNDEHPVPTVSPPPGLPGSPDMIKFSLKYRARGCLGDT